MKIDVYFLNGDSSKKEDLLSTINPVVAESHYFKLIKNKISTNGRVIVKSYNTVNIDGEYITGKHNDTKREKNDKRHKMIWANGGNEWIKPCPLQMRGLAMACCGDERGYQTKFAKLLDVDARTWRNWAKLINNKKQIPWYAWYAALNLYYNMSEGNLFTNINQNCLR